MKSKSVKKNKWALYEQAKLLLMWKNLTPEEYEKEIKKIVKDLKL